MFLKRSIYKGLSKIWDSEVLLGLEIEEQVIPFLGAKGEELPEPGFGGTVQGGPLIRACGLCFNLADFPNQFHREGVRDSVPMLYFSGPRHNPKPKCKGPPDAGAEQGEEDRDGI